MFDDLFSKEEYELTFGDEAEKIVKTLENHFKDHELSDNPGSDAIRAIEGSLDILANGDTKFYEGIRVGAVLQTMLIYVLELKEVETEE